VVLLKEWGEPSRVFGREAMCRLKSTRKVAMPPVTEEERRNLGERERVPRGVRDCSWYECSRRGNGASQRKKGWLYSTKSEGGCSTSLKKRKVKEWRRDRAEEG